MIELILNLFSVSGGQATLSGNRQNLSASPHSKSFKIRRGWGPYGSLYGAELAAPQEAGSNPQRFATGSGRTLGQAGEYATAPGACEHCFWLLASHLQMAL